jgi:6-phosphogluconolactonase/glucosamine-6-phosphate isomerase/deaminase
MLQVKQYVSAELAKTAAIENLQLVLTKAATKQQKVLLLLSGGSNLVIAEQLKELINHQLFTKYVLDERFSADPTVNNSLQLKALGIDVQETVPTSGEGLENFALRFDQAIQQWIKNNPTGQVVCTLGMGPDGHIAGISPMKNQPTQFKKTFFETPQIVIGYTGNLNPAERVTVTPNFLTTQIDVLVGLVVGNAKQAAWNDLISKALPDYDLPAQLLKRAKGIVTLFTDLS